jgi:hypothetical protein
MNIDLVLYILSCLLLFLAGLSAWGKPQVIAGQSAALGWFGMCAFVFSFIV